MHLDLNADSDEVDDWKVNMRLKSEREYSEVHFIVLDHQWKVKKSQEVIKATAQLEELMTTVWLVI